MSASEAGGSHVQYEHGETAQRPKGEGKRSYQRALRQAEKTGSTKYKGKILTLSELGGTPAITQSDRNQQL